MIKYYYFIGTEAELIKMTPTLDLFNKKKIPYKIISSGQNDIENSPMLSYLNRKVDIFLSKRPVIQNPLGLIYWFITSFFKGLLILRKTFYRKGKNKVWLIIHGDTVSTVLGALLGKIFRLKVAHVEAGYNSPSLFFPFPEEIDRTISSMLADVLFCPFDSIGKEVKKNKKNINIGFNTSIDSLRLALQKKPNGHSLPVLNKKKFFIFALHRQETLINKKLFSKLITYLINSDFGIHCLFALHHPTKKLLEELDLMKKLVSNKKITITSRLSYFEYIHILNKSEFIMTDGVGNQQETYYLGKPCLILRNLTEGLEGLNANAVISNNSFTKINKFIKEYRKYERLPITKFKSPSAIIVKYLLRK